MTVGAIFGPWAWCYEASAGHPPFQGRTTFEISSAMLHDAPPPLPSRVPQGLSAIIQHSLAKDPALRYQRASELQAALEAIQSASAIQQTPSEPRGLRTTVHRGIKHLQVQNGDVLLLVGTMKGVFLLRSSTRKRWDGAGPYFHGQSAYALAFDNRNGRHRLWANE